MVRLRYASTHPGRVGRVKPRIRDLVSHPGGHDTNVGAGGRSRPLRRGVGGVGYDGGEHGQSQHDPKRSGGAWVRVDPHDESGPAWSVPVGLVNEQVDGSVRCRAESEGPGPGRPPSGSPDCAASRTISAPASVRGQGRSGRRGRSGRPGPSSSGGPPGPPGPPGPRSRSDPNSFICSGLRILESFALTSASRASTFLSCSADSVTSSLTNGGRTSPITGRRPPPGPPGRPRNPPGPPGLLGFGREGFYRSRHAGG